jgi:hypothetical protein
MRFLLLIIYQDGSCFMGLDTYQLPRGDVRVMSNDPSVRDRAAKEARAPGAMDAVCIVTLGPMEVDDFMTVRRVTGPSWASGLELWWVCDQSKGPGG